MQRTTQSVQPLARRRPPPPALTKGKQNNRPLLWHARAGCGAGMSRMRECSQQSKDFLWGTGSVFLATRCLVPPNGGRLVVA